MLSFFALLVVCSMGAYSDSQHVESSNIIIYCKPKSFNVKLIKSMDLSESDRNVTEIYAADIINVHPNVNNIIFLTRIDGLKINIYALIIISSNLKALFNITLRISDKSNIHVDGKTLENWKPVFKDGILISGFMPPLSSLFRKYRTYERSLDITIEIKL
eukprot:500558_1